MDVTVRAAGPPDTSVTPTPAAPDAAADTARGDPPADVAGPGPGGGQGAGSGPGTMVLLTRLSRLVYRAATGDILGMGLKTFVLLNHLHEDVDVSQRQLGDHMCLPANNLVLLLNEVERAGWAARRRDPADRRRHLVRRTTAGTAALIRAERAMDSVEDQVLDHLTPQQRAALHALLSRTIDE